MVQNFTGLNPCLGQPVTAYLCQPAVNRYLFSKQGRIKQQKERDGRRLSYAVPQIQNTSSEHCPLWEIFAYRDLNRMKRTLTNM